MLQKFLGLIFCAIFVCSFVSTSCSSGTKCMIAEDCPVPPESECIPVCNLKTYQCEEDCPL